MAMLMMSAVASAADYVFNYDKASEALTLTWPEGTNIVPTYLGGAYIDGYDGSINLMPTNSTGDFFADNKDQLITYVALPDGNYTLVIIGGTYTINGVDNEKIEIPFTVGDGENPGGPAGEDKGVITITYPAADALIASISNGGLLAEFTTTKHYDQVLVELRNQNETYHNLYDLPIRYMDQLEPGSHTCKTQTPGETTYYLFKGDTYDLIVKGYVNYWDDNYDAIASVTIVGDGIAHEQTSDVKLVKVTPENGGNVYANDARVILEFDGPVSRVNGSTPGGFDAGTTYTGTAMNAEKTVWQIYLGDLSSVASAETETSVYEVDITAKDADGKTVVFSENRSDYALALMLNLTNNPNDVVTGISNVNTKNTNVKFNLAGQRVTSTSSATGYKGIIIENGKKHIVK